MKTPIQGLIFDIDGTLIHQQKPLPTAVQTFNRLRNMGIALRLISNTTSQTPEQLAQMLVTMGFHVQPHEIRTSVCACVDYIQTHFPHQRGYLAVPSELKFRLKGVPETKSSPDFILMGDLEDAFNYKRLNQIFRWMREGAQLITFHRNPFFYRDGETWLDSGAFTIALEASTQQQAVVIGKPAPALFESALQSMALLAEQVWMIGDDVTTDIQGAHTLGMTACLVGTGKYQPSQREHPQFPQAHFLTQLDDIFHLIQKPLMLI